MVTLSMDPKTGQFDPQKFYNIINGMEEGPRKIYFGDKADDMLGLAKLMTNIEAPANRGVGALFIGIRQPSAFISLATGSAELAGHFAGIGPAAPAYGALATSGGLLAMPKVFAHMMSSPLARKWMVKAYQATEPTVAQKYLEVAGRIAAQGTMRGAMGPTAPPDQNPPTTR